MRRIPYFIASIFALTSCQSALFAYPTNSPASQRVQANDRRSEANLKRLEMRTRPLKVNYLGTAGGRVYAASGPIQTHSNSLAAKIAQDAEDTIRQRELSVERAVAGIEAKLRSDMDHVPRYLSVGYSGSIANPDYDREISHLKRVARVSSDSLRSDLRRSCEALRSQAQTKIENLRITSSDLDEQLRSEHGAIGLIGPGTTVNVRNYMSFPDAAESDKYGRPIVPLKAGPPGIWVPPPKEAKKVKPVR